MARFRPEHLVVIGESHCGNGGTQVPAGRCAPMGSSLQQPVSTPPAQVASSKRNGTPIGLTVFCFAVMVPVFLTIFSASTGPWMRLDDSYQMAIPHRIYWSKAGAVIGKSDARKMHALKPKDDEVRSSVLNTNSRKGEELRRTEAERGDWVHSPPFQPPPPPPRFAAADGTHGLIALEGGPDGAAQRLLVITGTESRPFQAARLTELANALRLAPPPLIWIVVECGKVSTATSTVLSLTAGPSLLDGSALDYRHISTESVENSTSKCLDLSVERRRVLQRNAGLEYIQARGLQGIVYMADEDNIYDPYVFLVLKEVREVGVIPIGILGMQSPAFIEHPLVRIMEEDDDTTTPSGGANTIAMETAAAAAARGAGGEGGRKRRRRIVVGWHSEKWDHRRRKRKYRRWKSMGGGKFDFPVDLGAVAFNSELLWRESDPQTQRPMKPVRLFEVERGQSMETEFVNRLVVNASCLEPLGGRWEEDMEKEGGPGGGGGGGGMADEVLVWRRHQEAVHGQAYPVLWSGDHILPPPRPLTVPLDPNYRLTEEMNQREAKGVNDWVAFTWKNMHSQNKPAAVEAPSQRPATIKEAPSQQPATIKEAPSQQPATIKEATSQQPATIKEAPSQQPATIKEAPSQQPAAVTKTGNKTEKE